MTHIFDTLIIGGGPAGYSAALYAARAGLDTVVLEKMSAGGQMALTDTIDNYPGFEDGVDGFSLGMKMQQQAEKFGARSEYGQVQSVDFSGDVKKITADSGVFYAKTVIIATGADPKPLGLAGESDFVGRGVHYCAHCDGRFYKDKVVVVAGGGNSAAEDALYLAGLAKTVYLVHRRDELRASKVYHRPIIENEKIVKKWFTTVDSIMQDGKFTGVRLKNVQTGEYEDLPADALFVSIGRQPINDFLGDSVALDDYGYVIADETTKTNIPGVFAAGDIRTKALRQVVTAAADGAVAAHFAEMYLQENV